jgi:hypothetical protein
MSIAYGTPESGQVPEDNKGILFSCYLEESPVSRNSGSGGEAVASSMTARSRMPASEQVEKPSEI